MMTSTRVFRTLLCTVLSTGLLIGCNNPNLVQVDFDKDPGILRGAWSGTATEECNKPFQLLEWNTSSGELLAVRPYFNVALRKNGARVSVWDSSSGNKKLEWEVPWPAEKNTEYVQTFKYATFQNTVAAYDTQRVLLFERSSGAALDNTNFPSSANSDLGRVTLSANLERFVRQVPDTGYTFISDAPSRAQVFEVKTGQRIFDLALKEPLMGLGLNSDGSQMALNLSKQGIRVYSVSSGAQLYNPLSDYAGDLSFSPDSTFISNGYQIWRLEDGKAILPTREGGNGFNLLALSNSSAFVIDRANYPAIALSTYKLSDGSLGRSIPYPAQTQSFAVNPETGAFLSLTDGGCSAQLMSPDGTPGQKLNLEPLENFPLTLELKANYGNRDQYEVTGTASFRNSSFTVEGKVDGNTDNQFIQAQSRPPQSPRAELRLLKDGVVRYTFQLVGGRGASRYSSSGYGTVGIVEGGDRLFSLTLTKP